MFSTISIPLQLKKLFWRVFSTHNNSELGLNEDFSPIKFEAGNSLIQLGSEYGGWEFEKEDDLYGATILSFGVGEDISFDIEFANMFNAKMVLIDPTPRAVQHVSSVLDRLGHPASCSYVAGGLQPIESYNLESLTKDNISICERALWTEETKVPFFKPNNKKSVSHSIVNFKNDYNKDIEQPHILVNTITFEQLLTDYNISELPLIKMDIEGAELEVLPLILENNILPRQILVEFDGLQMKDPKNTMLYSGLDQKLTDKGYVCKSFIKPTNMLYVR